MKPLTLVGALAGAALFMAACDRATSIAGPQLSPPSHPASEVIHSKTNEMDVPWAPDLIQNCDGDPLVVTGTTHVIMTETTDSNGGFHRSWRFISKGTGTAPPSVVAEYKIDEQTSDDQNVQFPQGTYTNEQRLLVLAPAGEDNFIYHRITKFTFPANGGMPTASFDRSYVKCVG